MELYIVKEDILVSLRLNGMVSNTISVEGIAILSGQNWVIENFKVFECLSFFFIIHSLSSYFVTPNIVYPYVD